MGSIFRAEGSTGHLLHAGFLLGLFFDPEYGGRRVLFETSDDFQQTTRRYIPEDRTLTSESFKAIFTDGPKALILEYKLFKINLQF
jgi:hypothetical protein